MSQQVDAALQAEFEVMLAHAGVTAPPQALPQILASYAELRAAVAHIHAASEQADAAKEQW